MSSRIPEPPSEMEAEGVPDPGFSDATEATGAEIDAMEPPRDAALAVDDFGTTAAEMHDGEPLDGRIAREEPDVIDLVDQPADESLGSDTPFDERAGQGVGRLVESDEGARTDDETDLVAADVGTDRGGYSAEESAMHVEPEV
jgi:hypothetical protein